MPYLMFLASTVSETWMGPKISKVGHVIRFNPPPFYQILHFVR